jgi:hypothetical protein
MLLSKFKHLLNPKTLIRFAIQGLRLLICPFPISVFMAMTIIGIMDYIRWPERANAIPEPGEEMGEVILIILTVFMQFFVGMPSLLALDYMKRGFRTYLLAGTVIAVFISFVLAINLYAPEFGESLVDMFFYVFAFFGVPLIFSYLLAFFLKRLAKQ